MTFLRPGAFWLLLLAVPLILLHLRMRRRLRVVVPSLLAWDPSAAGGAPPPAPRGCGPGTSSGSSSRRGRWPVSRFSRRGR